MSASVAENVDAPRPLLFQPFRIRDLMLKNRLVVPPMVHYRAGPGSTCGIFHNVHLGRYALGGFGMVFVEATGVEEIGLINEHDLGIWNEAQVQGFKPLIAFMKGENTAMVGTWARAARNAVAAGFDAIEIHTAHGYLLASFLSPISNTRNDEYGGDRKGRMRLPLEIVEAVRREMPDGMPLFVRVSAVDGAKDGWNMDDTVIFARELKSRGVDVIDCSSGGISGSATAAQVQRGLGFQVPYAERVRNEVGIASMAVGIILEAQQAEAILQNGQADLIAIGRQSQFNPNIAHHWAHDLGINRKFEDWAGEYGWWLEKRIRTMEGFATPVGVVKRRAPDVNSPVR
jgi:2,4-dienoyl-CoA reductase-like NADH-dependent reductase (Old Yellow Enzyme family)